MRVQNITAGGGRSGGQRAVGANGDQVRARPAVTDPRPVARRRATAAGALARQRLYLRVSVYRPAHAARRRAQPVLLLRRERQRARRAAAHPHALPAGAARAVRQPQHDRRHAPR